MELVFSKVAACNFGLLHFLKQWGFCSFVHLQQAFRKQKHLWLSPVLLKLQAAGFNTNSSKIKFKLFQRNNYKILGINCVHHGSSRSQMFFKMTWKACNFIKKRLQRSCFPVKFAKFLRTPVLQNTSGGCFCRQNKSKETKRYFKKRYLRIFYWNIMTQRNRSNYKI